MRPLQRCTVGSVVLALLGGPSGVALAQDEPVASIPPAQPQPSDAVGIGGRVELPERSLVLAFPDGWVWARYDGDDLECVRDQVATLTDSTFAADTRDVFESLEPPVSVVATPGLGSDCLLYVYPTALTLDGLASNDLDYLTSLGDPGTESGFSVSDVEYARVSLPAGETNRFDYTLKLAGEALVLECHDWFGERPLDHWLSIAETIGFLPAE
jgi:hypothetical protein